jgi:hypothetical protein
MRLQKPINFWIWDNPILLDCLVIVGPKDYAREVGRQELASFMKDNGPNAFLGGFDDGGMLTSISNSSGALVCCVIWVNWLPSYTVPERLATIAHECVHWVDRSMQWNVLPHEPDAATEARAQMVGWCFKQILNRLQDVAVEHPSIQFQL